jgi:hypothetical protein
VDLLHGALDNAAVNGSAPEAERDREIGQKYVLPSGAKTIIKRKNFYLRNGHLF